MSINSLARASKTASSPFTDLWLSSIDISLVNVLSPSSAWLMFIDQICQIVTFASSKLKKANSLTRTICGTVTTAGQEQRHHDPALVLLQNIFVDM